MITLFEAKEDCCGCSACKTICPVAAIEFYRDDQGFEYPRINHDACISCGRCIRVCDFTKNIDAQRNPVKIYASKIKDDRIREKSSSGGMFTAFSDYFLSCGGTVYGAAHDENLNTVHIRAEDAASRDRCIGSKYVQSSIGYCFAQVRDDLKSGRKVFFAGTPCQVAGLQSFLKMSRCGADGLFTADLVCHGVPSPMLFQEFLKFCEMQRGKKIGEYLHRPKNYYGWSHNEQIIFVDGNCEYASSLVDTWKALFYSNAALRPSCYKCKYGCSHRYGDITIGDFWGIEETMPDFCDSKGVSLLFTNTCKSVEIFEKIKEKLIVRESNFEACLPGNPNLSHPSSCRIDKEKFWKIYNEKGFEALAKRYGGYGIKSRAKRALRTALEKIHLLNFALAVKNALKKHR